MTGLFSFDIHDEILSSDDLDDIASLRSASLASPAPSVYSLTSSLREQSFRLEHGRSVNCYSEVYGLPADEEEVHRLERQHQMFQAIIGPWPAPLPEVLTSKPGIVKSVLDLGCGSGAWIRDVARAFPHCSAVGVDLVPVQMPMPMNFRSEVDDINLGLEHFRDCFDVVHARFICSGIKHYGKLIDQIAECLRPWGLIALYENDFRLYRPDKTVYAPWSSIRPESEASHICRWFSILGHAIRDRGGSVDAAALLRSWISQHPSFPESDLVCEEYFVPIAPYNYRDEWVGLTRYPVHVLQMMNDDIHSFLRGGRLLLLRSGMSMADVDYLESRAHLEADNLTTPMFVRIQGVYARKKATL